MVQTLDLVWNFFVSQFDAIWALYTGGSVLGLSLILWILDHFFDIFDILKR